MPQHDLALPSVMRNQAERIAPQWRHPLARLGLAWVLLIALFLGDWAAMADQWWNSSTYNHVLFVIPISIWLVSLRLRELASLDPKPWWPALVLLAGALFLWLLGAISETNSGRQLGVVLAMQAAVIVLCGPRIAVALAFPLAFLLFLVPFGSELVPQLQMITAHITIALVNASGIPAHIDGVFIETPAGLFEVAEACSGVKFLVAMIALGVLASHLCFRSWRRRAVFMTACVVVPILANGVRAWGTIQIAQIYGIETAAGWDHIVYGWFFFALVMALVLLAAAPFFDRAANDQFVDPAALMRSPVLARLDGQAAGGRTALLAIVATAMVAWFWANAAARLEADLPERVSLPAVDGWEVVEPSLDVAWLPVSDGAMHRLLGHFRDREGREVSVFLALYSAQRAGSEAGGHGQGALDTGHGWSWLAAGPPCADGKSEYMLAQGRVKRLAVTWYRKGDLLTGSRLVLKLAVMRDKLLFRAQPVAVLIVSSEDSAREPAGESLRAFLDATGPLRPWMDRAEERP